MTDSRVSRVHAEALVDAKPDARVSRVHAEALVDAKPDARVSRVHAEVLWSDQAPVDPYAPAWSTKVQDTGPLWWWKADLNSGYMPVGEDWQRWPDEMGNGYDSSPFVGSVARRSPLIPSAAWTEWSNAVDDEVALVSPLGSGAGDPVYGSSGTVLMVFKRIVPDPTSTTSSSYFIERGDNELYVHVNGTTQNLSFIANGATTLDAVLKSEYNDGQTHVLLLRWGGGSAQLLWDWNIRATAAKTIPAATTGFAWYFQAGGHSYYGQEIVRDDTVFWDRRLTDAEITALKDAYFAPRPPRVGPSTTWWDGAIEQPANIDGWWDGASPSPVTVDGWWDGSSIQPLG